LEVNQESDSLGTQAEEEVKRKGGSLGGNALGESPLVRNAVDEWYVHWA